MALWYISVFNDVNAVKRLSLKQNGMDGGRWWNQCQMNVIIYRNLVDGKDRVCRWFYEYVKR